MGLAESLHDAAEHQPNVVLVHGIHSAEGTTNMRRLIPYFESRGFRVTVFEYGWLGVIRARWKNPGIARRLAALVRESDHLVCHSNGAAVAWLAMKNHGMKCRRISLIAPALDADKRFDGAIWADIYHNRCDHVVWLSRMLWWHSWGTMGRDGYTGPNAPLHGHTNIDTERHAALPTICGHLDYFAAHILPRLGPWMVRRHLEQS